MRALIAVVGCLAVAGMAAGPAKADSLAFIKDNNVWLAHPDGTGQYQVTFDGTSGAPYESPSQSNDGKVVAIRQTPGERRQVYRMTQSGRLLNAPINTPAPGTGAIDAKVSPNGALVAYWFVTSVNDPTCAFCVDAANEALLSYSDRFTNADAVGTPNTGGWPSWLDNDTITLGSGSPTQWYYTLGMPEAAEWFTDSLFTSSDFQNLLDAEVAPAGDRLAIVRGNNEETIAFLVMHGPPPAQPSLPNAACSGYAFDSGSSGHFRSPTWSSDGRLVAFAVDGGVGVDNGIYLGGVPGDLDTCSGQGAVDLIVPGGSDPDLSPAAINPGMRPACGNPGNPAACPGPPPPPPPPCCTPPGPTLDASAVRTALRDATTHAARSLARLKIGKLLRKRQFTLGFTAPVPGTLTAKLAAARGKATLASGQRVYQVAGKATLKVKLTAAGRKRLRKARRLKATLSISFKPKGGRRITTASKVRLRR